MLQVQKFDKYRADTELKKYKINGNNQKILVEHLICQEKVTKRSPA